ncbi:homoserine O-acetyltransferase [Thiovulum sp. ES]|nr:homoserine O-acetyltransferase [Thiovulum sp. ES]
MKIEFGKKVFKKPLYLESGRILEPYEIAYTTYGKLNSDKSNVIVITHALTGNQEPVKSEKNRFFNSGWWDSLIGDGKAIDTEKYFVIATNVIGSIFGSTSPTSKISSYDLREYRFKFPVITVRDMVKAQHILFQSLGIRKAKAIIGGSMGGMQGLQFGVDFPNFAEKIITIASTHATQPWAIAFNRVVSEAIKRDPQFCDGNYNIDEVKKNGLNGLAVGRMAGHISYLSHNSMKEKFGRKYLNDDGLFDINGRFQVDSYLDYNGTKFSKNFDPLSYLYLSKAVNMFDLSNNFGSLSEALSLFKADLQLISFRGDMLFRPEESEIIWKEMKKLDKNCQYHEIESDYGHDAFLIEFEKFSHLIEDFLN